MALRDFFENLGNALSDAFSGGGSAQDGDGPSRSVRPRTRPSIMTVERDGQTQRVATRDIPQYGITTGQTTTDPEYSAFSLQGLTSTETANVMRNIQASERATSAGVGEDVSKGERAAETEAETETEAGDEKGARPVEEGTGESAAARARRLGLASTIATTPGGLLAGGEGTTRQRRSLMGGGMIR